MKIATKNFILISSVIFMVVTIVLATLYYVMPIYYKQIKTSDAESAFSKVVKAIDGKTQEEMITYLSSYKQGNTQLFFTLSDGTNIIYPQLFSSESESDTEELQLTVISNASLTEIQTIRKNVTTSDKVSLTLEAEYSLQPVSDARQILLQLYPFILSIALIIGGIAAYISSRSSTKRIKEISTTTRKMSTLQPDLLCSVSGKDEVADLAQDINKMYAALLETVRALEREIEKVSENERSKEEFLRITSHELKTPITSMMGIVDGMIFEIGQFKDRDRYLKECRRILDEQSQLVQSILEISRLDMASYLKGNHWERFSLSQLLTQMMTTYELLAEMNHLDFCYTIEEATLTGNRTYLEKAIKNILDNAFNYSRYQGKINLVLTSSSLIIENQAKHVLSSEELTHVFTPFYRPDYSRNRKDGGTGLGLFIVQKILEQHHFDYQFEAIDKEWMRFSIFFCNIKDL